MNRPYGRRHRRYRQAYHEHLIRDEPELHHIRRYIEENPTHWAPDVENPAVAWPRDALVRRRMRRPYLIHPM